MSKLSIVTSRDLEKILLKPGFEMMRQKGSHAFYRHPDGRYTTLPRHRGQDLSRPLIRQILREIKLTAEEFSQLIENI